MTAASISTGTDLAALAERLGPSFAERAERYDEADCFAAENFADLKQARAFSACIPAELGGGGASHGELADFLRRLAVYCGSTALAFSMHSHVVATAVWRWRNDKAPLEPLLRKIAAQQLVLVSSGGADWLESSGTAEPAEGGFRIRGRKPFASGSPAGDLLMTSAVLNDPAGGPTVLHFPVPLTADGVSIEETWRCLGMRATGSDDIVLNGLFVPEAAVSVRRPKGKWHRLYHTIVLVALPIIYSVYVGIAEAARQIALDTVARRRDDPAVQLAAGEMETELAAARLAWRRLLDLAAAEQPSPEVSNEILMARSLAGRSAIRTVEMALELAGGRGFYRRTGLERRFRDVQGARFHPLQEPAQRRYSGRLALGLDIDG
ncbi:MAG TPA: acyl-CoA dehydrogenase family protein [Alphaproteobacteria bacterium]